MGERDWPQRDKPFSVYFNFGGCNKCGAQFSGPKRAPKCWSCWEDACRTAERNEAKRIVDMTTEYGPENPPLPEGAAP